MESRNRRQHLIKNSHGFSLIEILIALGILAGAMMTTAVAVYSAMDHQTQNEERLQAILLANNKMVEVEAQIEADMEKKKFPQEKEEDGEFEPPFENYKWTYAIKKVEIPLSGQQGNENAAARGIMQTIMKDLSKAVRELKVTVSWVDAETEKDKEIILTTHIVKLF